MLKKLIHCGWVIGAILAGSGLTSLLAAPAHPRPYLMPPAEKQRLLERIRTSDMTRRQYEAIKARADQGKPGEAAVVYALEGGDKHAAVVRRELLQIVPSFTVMKSRSDRCRRHPRRVRSFPKRASRCCAPTSRPVTGPMAQSRCSR